MNQYDALNINENQSYIEEKMLYDIPRALPQYVDHSMRNVYTVDFVQYRTYDCQRYVDYPCVKCHDREVVNIFGKKVIVTTCGTEICRETFNSKCTDVRENNLRVDLQISIPRKTYETYGTSIHSCIQQTIRVVTEELGITLNGLALIKMNYDEIVKKLLKSVENFKKALYICLAGNLGQFDKSLIDSIIIVPQYDIKTVKDWQPAGVLG